MREGWETLVGGRAFTVGKGCRAPGTRPQNGFCRMKTAAGLLSTSENPRLQWFRKDTLFLCQVQSPEKAVQAFCQGVRLHLPAPSRCRPPSSMFSLGVQGLLRLPDGIIRKQRRSKRAQPAAAARHFCAHITAQNAGIWLHQLQGAGTQLVSVMIVVGRWYP